VFLGKTKLLDKRSIFWYELVGMVLIIILGSMLHFTFEWSGNQPIIGVFSAVNESVWEHLKIAFWPTLLYAIFEYNHLNKKTNNFFFVKIISLVALVILALAFVVFTFYPPQIQLFQDPNTGEYGIINHLH